MNGRIKKRTEGYFQDTEEVIHVNDQYNGENKYHHGDGLEEGNDV